MRASSSSGAHTPPGFHRQRKYQILFITMALALVIGSIFIWYKYFYPKDQSEATHPVDKNTDRRKRSFTSRDQEKMAQEAFQKEGVVPDVIDVAPKIKAEVRFRVYC